jgi:hypothetical protein
MKNEEAAFKCYAQSTIYHLLFFLRVPSRFKKSSNESALRGRVALPSEVARTIAADL